MRKQGGLGASSHRKFLIFRLSQTAPGGFWTKYTAWPNILEVSSCFLIIYLADVEALVQICYYILIS